MEKVIKTEQEWKKILTPFQFEILRKGGIEKSFTGKVLDNKEKGTYLCAGCNNPLFSSSAKYDSGTGWPSFFAPLSKDSIAVKFLPSGINGSEVLCARCDGHHGHVFTDGPKPTGLRFCMNSEVLKFIKQ